VKLRRYFDRECGAKPITGGPTYHLTISVALGAVLALTTAVASAEGCTKSYIVKDNTTLSIIGFFYEQNDAWSNNLLAAVISPGTSQMIHITGSGSARYKVVLSGNRIVLGSTNNICSQGQIVVFPNGASPTMVIN
jgi:hypothetical protein